VHITRSAPPPVSELIKNRTRRFATTESRIGKNAKFDRAFTRLASESTHLAGASGVFHASREEALARRGD
jgi:hypothetical protein